MAGSNATRLKTPFDLASQRRAEESEKSYNVRRERELDDVAWLMAQPRGRRFVYRLLTMSNVFSSSFTGNSETFFNEGRRVIGTTLIKDLVDAGLEELELKMKIEHREELRKEATKDDD